MPIFSIAKIFYIFCVFRIPYTGCLFKHAPESKLSCLVSVLDRFRYNYVYRPPKTLRRPFWPFQKISGQKYKKRSTVSIFSIGGIFGSQYVYF